MGIVCAFQMSWWTYSETVISSGEDHNDYSHDEEMMDISNPYVH